MKKKMRVFSIASLILMSSSFPFEALASKVNEDKRIEFGLSGNKIENKEAVKIQEAVDIGKHSPFSGEVALTNTPRLTFNASKLENKDILVEAKGAAGEAPGIRVDDVSGKGLGWTVTVKASEFVSTKDPTVTLNGAKLIFPANEAVSFANTISKKPRIKEAQVPFNNQNNYRLIEAKTGEGMGAWEVAYKDNSSIKMELPAGQLLGTYQATVTYTLTVGQLEMDTAK